MADGPIGVEEKREGASEEERGESVDGDQKEGAAEYEEAGFGAEERLDGGKGAAEAVFN